MIDVQDINISKNTSNFTTNITTAKRCGNEVKVYPYVIGIPAKGRTIATGLPAPKELISMYAPGFGQVQLNTNGILFINSQAVTTSAWYGIPFSYWVEQN